MTKINLLKLKDKDKKILEALFKDNTQRYLANTKYTVSMNGRDHSVSLSHAVLRRARKADKEGERFEIQQPLALGQGAHAKVYEVYRTLRIGEHGAEYTNKGPGSRIIKYISDFDEESIKNEYLGMQASGHLSVKPIGTLKDKKFFVMKRMPGKELTHALKDLNHWQVLWHNFKVSLGFSPSLVEKQLTMCLFVLLAAKYQISDKGLIHRDIKPANIVFDEKNAMRFHFIDFDAVVLKNQPLSNYAGSPAYLAPEAWARFNPASLKMFEMNPNTVLPTLYPNGQPLDIYSLGIVLGEILGYLHDLRSLEHTVFNSDKKSRSFNQFFASTYAQYLNKSQKKKLNALLNAMVAPDPAHRPTIVGAIHTLKEILIEHHAAKRQKADNYSGLYKWAFSTETSQDLDEASWMLMWALKKQELNEQKKPRLMHHQKVKPLLEEFVGEIEKARAKNWNNLWKNEKKEVIAAILDVYVAAGGDREDPIFKSLDSKYSSAKPEALKSNSSYRRMFGIACLIVGISLLVTAALMITCTYFAASVPALYIAGIGKGVITAAVASLTATTLHSSLAIGGAIAAGGFFSQHGMNTLLSPKTKAIGATKESLDYGVELVQAGMRQDNS